MIHLVRGNVKVVDSSGSFITQTNRFPVESDDIARALKVDEVSGTLTFFGWAIPGSLGSAAVWRILRMLTTGDLIEFQFADGDNLFNNVWDDRASLTYI